MTQMQKKILTIRICRFFGGTFSFSSPQSFRTTNYSNFITTITFSIPPELQGDDSRRTLSAPQSRPRFSVRLHPVLHLTDALFTHKVALCHKKDKKTKKTKQKNADAPSSGSATDPLGWFFSALRDNFYLQREERNNRLLALGHAPLSPGTALFEMQ